MNIQFKCDHCQIYYRYSKYKKCKYCIDHPNNLLPNKLLSNKKPKYLISKKTSISNHKRQVCQLTLTQLKFKKQTRISKCKSMKTTTKIKRKITKQKNTILNYFKSNNF